MGVFRKKKKMKQQHFNHLAWYRFADLGFPADSGEAAVQALRDRKPLEDDPVAVVLDAVAEACREQDWKLVGFNVLPDRVEVSVCGQEAVGSRGHKVARILDEHVFRAALLAVGTRKKAAVS